MRMRFTRVVFLATLAVSGAVLFAPQRAATTGPVTPYPILFVTQIPIRSDFTTIGSAFGNHRGALDSVGRGGDLWIRYADGTLRNLTQAAGLGGNGLLTGDSAIAARDPSVHWDGTKALFSLVIGAPSKQFQAQDYYWQLYEVTGFQSATQTVAITKVPNQPANYNNVSPIYGTDGRIVFTSDRPRDGSALLYPQLDEYEEKPTNTGLWSLDPATGDIKLLNHAPSGDFTPSIDSFGRLVFTQWDHLQRDQQADADAEHVGPHTTICSASTYGTFNYTSERSSAYNVNDRVEMFPEARKCRTDLLAGTHLTGHDFNHFFPWQIFEDGRESEILNHLGRHELGVYIDRALDDDANIVDFSLQYGDRSSHNPIRTGIFQIKESPAAPGTYYGVDSPEFGTHASGQIISLTAPIAMHANDIEIRYVTHRDTYGTSDAPNHSGRYREPLPLSDGTLVAVHTIQKGQDATSGGPFASTYDFRLKTLVQSRDGYWVADQPLTGGISKSVSYWSPDISVSFNGVMWELNPVEVRPRAKPARLTAPLAAPEQQTFTQANVDVTAFRSWLTQNNLAVAVVRNVTTRDALDRQQPFNLRVPGGAETLGAGGRIYDVTHLQFFQAEQLRGLTGCCGSTPNPGRRVIARLMGAPNPSITGQPSSVAVAGDGSAAAFVPALRALTWQLTNGDAGVVRERVWVTFQPGEIRTCPSCHGPSTLDQAGHFPPENPPQALLGLLNDWKTRGR